MLDDDFDKKFGRVFSFLGVAWVTSAIAGLIACAISAIAGLALVGAIIYFLVKAAAAL